LGRQRRKGRRGKIKNERKLATDPHPDEIEKKKHFIGQADTHGPVRLKRGSGEAGK